MSTIRKILIASLLILLTACGSDNDSDDSPVDSLAQGNDLLQGDPFSPAVNAVPKFLPEPAYADDFIVASVPGLVAGLKIHRTRLALKLSPAATVTEINDLLETVGAVIVGSDFDDVLHVELQNNPSQLDLVNAINQLEASDAIILAVEDLLINLNASGETAQELPEQNCFKDGEQWTVSPSLSEWAGTYFGSSNGNWSKFLDVPGPGVEEKTTRPGGNWWLEFVRMPAAWNFNDAIERRARNESKLPRELSAPIGVVDEGFETHDDIPLSKIEEDGTNKCHGNLVAGIIAAYQNRHQDAQSKGIDGSHPYSGVSNFNVVAEIEAQLKREATEAGLDVTRDAVVTLLSMTSSIKLMLKEYPLTRIVNFSYGLDAFECHVNKSCALSEDDPELKRLFEKVAELTWDAIKEHDVLIISAAGNNSNLVKEGLVGGVTVRGHGAIPAKFSSPVNYLALEGFQNSQGLHVKADNILVVEAVGWQGDGGRRYWQSSTGGQLAAPGTCITSTAIQNGYAAASGTSFAAPLVSGLAGYLLTVDSGLSAAEIKNIILQSSIPMGAVGSIYVNGNPCSMEQMEKISDTLEPDQPPIIDAFAAVMQLNDSVLKLVDADDGTPDGATVSGPANEIPLPGDGKISMADFRAFRDAVLQLRHETNDPQQPPLENPFHIRRDNNRDGCVHDKTNPGPCPVPERIWSRFDFNGDGALDETLPAPLRLPDDPPELPAPERTDLDILRLAWPGLSANPDESCNNRYHPETEGWCENDLSALIDSRDVVIDFSAFEPAAGDNIEVRVEFGGNRFRRRYRFGDDPVMVFTVPHDADCALVAPTKTNCLEYRVTVVAQGISIVRSGGANKFGDGSSTAFYSQPLGHDEVFNIHPQVTLTLTPFAGKSNETEMTALATYNIDDPNILFDPDAAARRDQIRIICPFISCASVLDVTRSQTDMTYRFVPTQVGDYSVIFEIREFCEAPDPVDCPPPSPVPRLNLAFQVVEGTPPEPEPIPPPDPEPEPLPPIDPPPLPPLRDWSFTDPVESDYEYICDQASKTITTTLKGTVPHWPTKSDPSYVETVNEVNVKNLPDNVLGYCLEPPLWWNFVYYETTSSAAKHILTSSSAYRFTGEQGSRRLHIKTKTVGHRASCEGDGVSRENGCYPYTWHSGYYSNGQPWGYYTFSNANIYPARKSPTFE